jgi:hypothetical protein
MAYEWGGTSMRKTYVSPESIIECIQLLPLQLPLVLERVRVVTELTELVERVRVPWGFDTCGVYIVVEDRADVGNGVGRPDVVGSRQGRVKEA